MTAQESSDGICLLPPMLTSEVPPNTACMTKLLSAVTNKEVRKTLPEQWAHIFQEFDCVAANPIAHSSRKDRRSTLIKSYEVLTAMVIKSLEAMVSVVNQNQNLPGLLSSFKLVLANTSEENIIQIQESFLLTVIKHEQMNEALAALINAPLRVEVVSSPSSESDNQRNLIIPRLNAKSVAELIIQSDLDIFRFKSFAQFLSLTEIKRAMRHLALSPHLSLSIHQKAQCLKILSEAPQFSLDLQTLELCLNTNHISIAYSISSRFKQNLRELLLDQDECESFWKALSLTIEDGLLLELKLWFIKEYPATSNFARQLCQSNCAFSLSRNPIKSCLLFYEVLGILKQRYSVQLARLEQKQNAVIELCGLFLQQITDTNYLLRLLHQFDLFNRQTLFLIKNHPLLLNKIESLIEHQWEGSMPIVSSNTFCFSTLFRISVGSIKPTVRQMVCSRQYWKRMKDSKSALQFGAFRRSSCLKYLYGMLVHFVIAACMTIFGNDTLTFYRKVIISYTQTGVLTLQSFQFARDGVNSMRYFALINWPLAGSFILIDFLDLFFSWWTKRRNAIWTPFETFVDLAIVLDLSLLLVFLDLTIFKFQEKSILDYIPSLITLQGSDLTEALLGLFAALIWLKSLFLLRVNTFIGPLLTIIFRMSLQILKFCLLLGAVLLSFASLGLTLFSNYPSGAFRTFDRASITLYSAMLGQFQFSDVQPASGSATMGKLYLTAYLLINMVLLLNLLIAILSNTYSLLSEKGLGLYLAHLIDIQPRWLYHSKHNALTWRVPPLHVLNILFLPCIRKGFHRINNLLQRFHYLPAYCLILGLMVAINIASVPFACLKFLLQKDAKHILFALTLFPLLAPFTILVDFFISIFKLMENAKPKQKKMKKRPLVEREDLQVIERVLETHYSGSSEEVPLSVVVKRVREELPFTFQFSDIAEIALRERDPSSIRGLLNEEDCDSLHQAQANSSFLKRFHPSQSRVLDFFKERRQEAKKSISIYRFEKVKAFLARNSYRGQDQSFYIYPGLLLAALNEVKDMPHLLINSIQTCAQATCILDTISWMEVGVLVRCENEFRIEGGDIDSKALQYTRMALAQPALKQLQGAPKLIRQKSIPRRRLSSAIDLLHWQ